MKDTHNIYYTNFFEKLKLVLTFCFLGLPIVGLGMQEFGIVLSESRKIMRNEVLKSNLIDPVIHHINMDWRDNRKENLQIMTREEHSSLHGGVKKNYPKKCKRKRISKIIQETIINLHNFGFSNRKISITLGISDTSVAKYLNK